MRGHEWLHVILSDVAALSFPPKSCGTMGRWLVGAHATESHCTALHIINSTCTQSGMEGHQYIMHDGYGAVLVAANGHA